jgi:hypothetical protein
MLMTLNELFSQDEDSLIEEFLAESATMAWGKSGDKIVKKYRCLSGTRKGRLVTNPGDCSKRIDPKKRIQMKKTMAKLGKRIARKSKRTKRVNPTSKKVASRNVAMKG